MIKQIVLPNYFTAETHYYAEAYAMSVNKTKFKFKKPYMNMIMDFQAVVKYNKQKDTTFVELDEIGGGNYSDVVMLKGNPNKENIRRWMIKRW